ncbi:ABC transporter ATP-binding protein/permease [Fenollaria sporofastidiosus]|uniref:ABC transporter ATP-binding protein/permease n=1 Tax=Fenollaria sporofastidiosus TaxID=2811778 RepID=UPI001C002441|nr:ABC transporter ATP-binding protein/permease [Fenollaria sporofastidiosus]
MLDKYLFKSIGKAKKYILSSVFMMMLRVVGTALLAFAFGSLAEALYSKSTIDIKKLLIIFVLGIAIRVLALYKVTDYQSNIIGEVKGKLRERLITKAASIGPSYKEQISTATLINLGSDTIEQLQNYYGRFLPEYYGAFGASLVNFAILSYIDWRVGLVFLVLMPIIPLLLKFILTMVGRMQKKYWRKYQDVGELFLDSLQGITALKIFRADIRRAEELDEKAEDFRNETMRILAMQLNSITLIEWIAYGSSIACIFTSLYVYTKTGLALNFLIMILIMSMDAFRPMITLTSSFHVAMTGVAAGKTLIDFLELNEDDREAQFPNDKDLKLSVKKLSYKYPDGDSYALNNITIDFPTQGYIALVGESGSGKSTLAKLISAAMRGTSGDVFIGSAPYTELASASIAKNVNRITHNAHIFEGALRENIVMARDDVSDSAIYTALKKVNLYDEIMDKGGLEMPLSSGGLNLSGGQRQRLALARAMVYDPKIFIFDEATSNIDIESEEIILNNIKEIAKEKLVIIVSHRLSSIKDADKIYVMAKANLVEEGTHETLMKQCGEYKRIYDAQESLEGGLNDAK